MKASENGFGKAMVELVTCMSWFTFTNKPVVHFYKYTRGSLLQINLPPK